MLLWPEEEKGQTEINRASVSPPQPTPRGAIWFTPLGKRARDSGEKSDHMLAEMGRRRKYLYSQRNKAVSRTLSENSVCGQTFQHISFPIMILAQKTDLIWCEDIVSDVLH